MLTQQGPKRHQLISQICAIVAMLLLAIAPAAHALRVDSSPAPTTTPKVVPLTRDGFIQALTPQPSRGIGIVKDQPKKPVDTKVALQIQFAFGSAQLTPKAMETLIELGKAINSKELMPYRFLIVGHTDAIGSAEANQILSEDRAWAVVNFLEENFVIEPGRLIPAGMGELDPIDPCPCSCINRRVEISNIGQFQPSTN